MVANEVVVESVKGWVKTNRPFALLRFGDGEGLFAKLHGSSSKMVQASVKHWGHVPGRVSRIRIEHSIKKAYDQCDVAGLPFGFDSSGWRGSLQQFLLRPVQGQQIKCSANIHIDMDQSGFIAELVKGRRVLFVGCRDIRAKMAEMGALSTEIIATSEQYKFAVVKPLLPFYLQVEDIEMRIRRMDLKGTVCLLAAGVAGKYIGIVMRDRGGMVIDIGSVADKWAGVKSRSWIKVGETV